jgi:fibronectin type 3 domain-containing protein
MAVAGVGTIELAWERNVEDDFQGYNVYRSSEGAAFEKIAALIDAPAYSDRQIEAVRKYRYAVSAVDQTGNESRRSEPVEAAAE